MITFSPTYVTINPTKRSYSITTQGDSNDSLKLSWVIITPKEEGSVTFRECVTTISPLLTYTLTNEEIVLLTKCIEQPGELIGLKITSMAESIQDSVGAEESVVVPFLIESETSLFLKSRDTSVLGEFQKVLVVENFHCNNTILFKPETVTCSAFIKNTTIDPVLVDSVIAVRNGYGSSVKSYEEISQSAKLILPNQQIQLSFKLPEYSLQVGINTVDLRAGFRSPGIVTPPYISQQAITLYYIPALPVIIVILTLSILSVILSKRILPKLLHRNNGATKKTNHS